MLTGIFPRLLSFLLAIVLSAGCASSLPTTDEPLLPGKTLQPENTTPPDTSVISPAGPQPSAAIEHPWRPVPDDVLLEKGAAFVESSQLLVLESFPPQFVLSIQGSLPTPCHQLRIQIADPDLQQQIVVEVYSVVDPQAICVQMLQNFEASVTLPTPPNGQSYIVILNGNPVGEISV